MELVVYNFIVNFTGILYEAMPWVVVGAAFAGLVQELPPRRAPACMLGLGLAILTLTVSPYDLYTSVGVATAIGLVTAAILWVLQPFVDGFLKFLAARRGLAIFMSGFLGLVNPMCDCGVIVVMRRLLRKGLPLSCCITYILSGPIINVLVLATTYQAFQNTTPGSSGVHQMGSYTMLGFRAGMGFITAVVTGFIVERLYRVYGAKLLAPSVQLPSGLPIIELDEYGETRKGNFWKSLANISESALHDFVDVMVPLIIGALLAAGIKHFLSRERIEDLSNIHPLIAIPLLMLVGFLITLCSETDAFVIATFTLRPAAKLAFLVLGPMFDLKLLFMYTRVFRPRLMWTIILSITIQIFLYSYLTHLFWENLAPQIWPDPAAPTVVSN